MFDPEEAHEGEVLEGAEWPAQTQIIKYSVTESEILAKLAEFKGIDFKTSEGYEQGRKAIALCVSTRMAIEETRERLKKPSLEFGRKVDALAKRFKGLIVSTEEKLVADRKVVDDEKERIRAEKKAAEEARQEAERAALRAAEQAEIDRQRAELEAERKKLEADKAAAEAHAKAEREAREAEERRVREAKEAHERAEREKKEEAERAERKRIEESQEAERQRLAAERRKLEDEQKAERDRAAAERQKLEDERRAVEREKERLAREAIERDVRERTERETRERVIREQKEAEEAKSRREKHEADERSRIEALKPDLEKVLAFAAKVRAMKAPEVSSAVAKGALGSAEFDLDMIAGELEAFATTGGLIDAES